MHRYVRRRFHHAVTGIVPHRKTFRVQHEMLTQTTKRSVARLNLVPNHTNMLIVQLLRLQTRTIQTIVTQRTVGVDQTPRDTGLVVVRMFHHTTHVFVATVDRARVIVETCTRLTLTHAVRTTIVDRTHHAVVTQHPFVDARPNAVPRGDVARADRTHRVQRRTILLYTHRTHTVVTLVGGRARVGIVAQHTVRSILKHTTNTLLTCTRTALVLHVARQRLAHAHTVHARIVDRARIAIVARGPVILRVRLARMTVHIAERSVTPRSTTVVVRQATVVDHRVHAPILFAGVQRTRVSCLAVTVAKAGSRIQHQHCTSNTHDKETTQRHCHAHTTSNRMMMLVATFVQKDEFWIRTTSTHVFCRIAFTEFIYTLRVKLSFSLYIKHTFTSQDPMRNFLLLLSLAACSVANASEVLTIRTDHYAEEGTDNSNLNNYDCGNQRDANGCYLDVSGVVKSGNKWTINTNLNMRSQMRRTVPSYASDTIDTSNYPNLKVGEGNRFIEKEVKLTVANEAYTYGGCQVDLIAGIKDKVVLLQRSSTDTSTQTYNDDNNGVYSCKFMLSNNQFIGDVKVKVTFTYTDSQPVGGQVETIVELPIAIKPHDDDLTFQEALTKGDNYLQTLNSVQERGSENTMLRDVVLTYNKYCEHAGGYFLRDGDDCTPSETTRSEQYAKDTFREYEGHSGAGAKVHLSGIFLDRRYRVADATGAGYLKDSIGDIKVAKGGLALSATYKRFNNNQTDVSANRDLPSLQLIPIPYGNKKSSNAADRMKHSRSDDGEGSSIDYSNVGAPFLGNAPSLPRYRSPLTDEAISSGDMSEDEIKAAYDCVTDSDKCFAQYRFSHDFRFSFGDLPQFQPGYINPDGCAGGGCPHTIGIQMFPAQDSDNNEFHHVDSIVSVSRLDLPSDLNTINIEFPELVAKDTFHEVPTGEISTDISIGDLFDVLEGQTTTSVANLDSSIGSIFTNKFAFFATSQGGSSLSGTNVMKFESGKCSKLIDLVVSDLGTDNSARFREFFTNDCKLSVPRTFYGTVHQITYPGLAADAAVSVRITEIDQRSVSIGGTALSESLRTSVTGSRVATTITLVIKRDYPQLNISSLAENLQNGVERGGELSSQRAVYRIHGGGSVMAGFVSKPDGGGECTGKDYMYWRSAASRDDRRIYKEVWSGSEEYVATHDGETAADKGRPYGVCSGVSSDNPLVKENATDADFLTEHPGMGATVDAKSLVRYRRCKEHSGAWQIVSVPDASISGTDCIGLACDSGHTLPSDTCTLGVCDNINVDSDCTQVAKQEEVLFYTKEDTSDLQHTISTTSSCTGILNFQVEDTTKNQEFAIYRASTACSRMSASNIDDKVHLEYKYTSHLSLVDDSATFTATPSMLAVNNTFNDYAVICSKNNLNVNPNQIYRTKEACDAVNGSSSAMYVVEPFFGTCNNDNSMNPKGSACLGNLTNGEWGALSGNKYEATSDSSALQLLKACSDQVVTTNADAYTITYDMALHYTRTLIFDAATTIQYCDSQTFTTTINRDATASVTTASIDAAALNRAVYVQDIGWTSCGTGDDNKFRLDVLLVSKDQDSRDYDASDPAAGWVSSKLTGAYPDTAAIAENPNDMSLHGYEGMIAMNSSVSSNADVDDSYFTSSNDITYGPSTSYGDRVQVRGQCILVDACVPSTVDGTWGKHSQEFKTDLVIRGFFQSKSVDTRVALTLNFNECPLSDAAGTVVGKTAIGLHATCTDKQNDNNFASQSVSQPATNLYLEEDGKDQNDLAYNASGIHADLKMDCTSAYADDVFRVEASLFAVTDDCFNNPEKSNHDGDAFDNKCTLDKEKHDEALEQGWSIDAVDIYLDELKPNANDELVVENTVQLCRCEKNLNCQVIHYAEPGSIGPNQAQYANHQYSYNFKRLSEVQDGSFEHYIACGVHGQENKVSEESNWSSSGVVEVGNDFALMQIPLDPLSFFPNSKFRIRYETSLQSSSIDTTRRRLRATYPIKLRSTQGASASTNGVEVLQLASESYDANGAASEGSNTTTTTAAPATTTAAAEEKGLSTVAIVLIVLGSLAAAGALVWFALCRSGSDGSASMEERTAFVGGAVRQQRFSNLRY